jgi:monothiol glutaredoxin
MAFRRGDVAVVDVGCGDTCLNYIAKSDRFAWLSHCSIVEVVMDVIERIKKQIDENPILLYMKGTPDFPQCGFSARAVQILNQCGTQYAYVNVFEDPEVRENLKVYSQWPTFPQLFINGELVGGSDIMMELFHSGELQKMLAKAPATTAAS